MTTTQTKYFLFEIRESDGNDCRVYDCIVEAGSQDEATDKLFVDLDAKAAKGNWESDGDMGYYFPCTCEVLDEPTDDPSECEQCEVLSINGTACHEAGCPTYAQYERDLKAFERWDDRMCEHGGLNVTFESEHATEDDAENACARYHSRYEI